MKRSEKVEKISLNVLSSVKEKDYIIMQTVFPGNGIVAASH